MNPTQQKVQRNLAGLEFLLSRPDTHAMLPQSKELDKCELLPAFYVCRAIMRDNLTVICVSLRVNIVSFTGSDEKYTIKDIHGRGTTFEMALFDLSAQLIKTVEENDIIDTDIIPTVEERIFHAEHDTENTDKGVRTNESGPVESSVNPAEQDVGKGLAARSDNTGGNGTDARRISKSGRKTADGSRGRGRIKRSGR